MTAISRYEKRGRPRSFDIDEAVTTAEQLFREKGYEGVGVAEIGKALGITPPSFYAAFGSKLGLFERVIAHYEAGDARFFPDALATEGPATAAIARLLDEAAEAYAARPGQAGCLVLDGTRGSGDAGALALTRARREAAEAAVRERIARDLPDRADRLAPMVMIALRGLSTSSADGVAREDLRAFALAAARMIAQEAERQ